MKNRNGYVLVYKKDHHRAEKNGIVYEHILVAEQILGRELKKEEVVHHIDEDRSNNKPENLMVFASHGDHTAYHRGMKIYQIENVWFAEKKFKICPVCKQKFFRNKNSINKRTYCSRKCARQASYKTDEKYNDIEEIQKILKLYNGNFTKASKKIGISVYAIVRRLKVRNLPYHSNDYKVS